MKIYNYEINESNTIISCSINNIDTNKPVIILPDDQKIFVGISKIINTKFISNESIYLRIKEINKQLEQIRAWLWANDWKINKIVVEEWSTSDPRWLEYLKERNEKLKLQDQLLKEFYLINQEIK